MNRIKIEPYKNSFHGEVIECMKRNFPWMRNRTDDEINIWLEPLWTYNWLCNNEKNPYKYGIVILDENGKVVGYLGFIFSWRKTLKGYGYKYANPSYWAIDKPYRLHLFRVLREVFKYADVISDFTAIPAVQEVLKNIFKFKIISRTLYQFFPIPYLKSKNIHVNEVDYSNLTEYEKVALSDHCVYGVKVIDIQETTTQLKSSVFYRVFNASIKRLFPIRCIQILKVSNKEFFTNNIHEIVWNLQLKEKSFLQCDEIFILGDVKHPLLRKKKVYREILNKLPDNHEIDFDFLYSELAILNDSTGNHFLV